MPDFSAQPGPAIVRDQKGKPYFASVPDLHFSLSHSGAYAACAFHRHPVGIDLQYHTDCRREAIARRFFHPDEVAYLEKTGFEPFFQVWAAKESYVKFTGSGIANAFGAFSVATSAGLIQKADGAEYYRRELPGGYSLCLCAAEIPGVRFAQENGDFV